MKNFDFRKIINEEISDFNFLGVDDMLKEQEELELLQNEEFQKQFIIDSITNLKGKVKILETETAYMQEPEYDKGDDNTGSDNVFLEYFIKVEYSYNEAPIKFKLDFTGEVNLSWDGWHDPGKWGGTMADAIEPSGELWIDYIEWDNIQPNLRTMDNDDIEFTAFENAGEKTQELFIRAYVEDIVAQELDAELRVEKPPQYSSFNLQ